MNRSNLSSFLLLGLSACILYRSSVVYSFAPLVGPKTAAISPEPSPTVLWSTVTQSRRPTSNRQSRRSVAGTSGTRRRQRTVADRTQAETQSLIQDIIQAAVDAGPQAGPLRTFEAYRAVSETIREFYPLIPGRPVQEFSVPKAVRTLFEKLGATYIKLGQFIASSPTLFPKEYVVEFQKCLDKTDPVEWNVIKRVIVTELGPISKNFISIDPKPLASASIAQVHAAKLKTGEDVVIKVQKPGIDSSLKADLSFIYVASRVLEYLQPDWERTSLSGVAADIRSSMLEELDFEKEALNTEQFRNFLATNNLLNQATAPKVIRDLTTKKVMTMERLNGISMLDEETISKVTRDPNMGQAAIISALNIWTTSVMKMPWFHADVHAGNLLLLDDGRIGFIDFGIVGRVSDKTFSAINQLSTALALADYRGMAQALCNMGATDEEVDIDKFGRDIEAVMGRIASVQPDVTITQMADGSVGGTLDFDESEITNLLLELVDITEDNGLKLPREFGLLVKQSLYFDRYIKILAPDLDVMTDGRVTGLGTDPSDPSDLEVHVQVNGSSDANGARELVIDV
jgi:aarF domain-containing kinase